ncbi:hypothetical protein C9374_006793 [Naegleria lovaniensis]|uniref:F-box domain-containing protein n=1 Tax=Naegleria lovaniensis TaxID=51637 RepID=A0AA88KRI1_NAELO|nr:uncharacterized protein C9374_006793 [Naegleria lovaniensis]KAG2393262.1 hypothetical protein C9374_006793 [Naegleria lovaniensis]
MTPPTLTCTTSTTTTSLPSSTYKEQSPNALHIQNNNNSSESSPTSSTGTPTTHRISHGGTNDDDDSDSMNTSNSMLSRKRASHPHEEDDSIIHEEGFGLEDQEGALMMMDQLVREHSHPTLATTTTTTMNTTTFTMDTPSSNHNISNNGNNNQQTRASSIGDILKGLASQRSSQHYHQSPLLFSSPSSSSTTTTSSSISNHHHHNENTSNNNIRKHSSPNNLFHEARGTSSSSNSQSSMRASSTSSPASLPVTDAQSHQKAETSSKSSKKKKHQQQQDIVGTTSTNPHQQQQQGSPRTPEISTPNADTNNSPNRKLSLSLSIQKRISSWRSNHKNSNMKSNKKEVPAMTINQQQEYKHSRSHSESHSRNNEESTVLLLLNSTAKGSAVNQEKKSEKNYGTIMGSSSSSSLMEDHHSSNSQMQSLKSILAHNKHRHHNNYEHVDSDESPVLTSTAEPLSPPFSSSDQHNIHTTTNFESPPKLVLSNQSSNQQYHSQLKPKKLDFSTLDNSSNRLKLAPLTSRARGDSSIKHPFDYLKGSISHQPTQSLSIPVVLTRKRSLPTTPEFLNTNSHNRKPTPRDDNSTQIGEQQQQQTVSTSITLTTPRNTSEEAVLVSSTKTPTDEGQGILISIPTTAEYQIVVEKTTPPFMQTMSADTLLLVSSFIYDDNYEKQIESFSFLTSHDIFTTLMLVCRAWHEKLNDDLVWSFRYRQFLNNLLKHYSKSVNAYFVTYGNEKHPLQKKSPNITSSDFDKKYTPIHKRYKFLKHLQKELNNFKPPLMTNNHNTVSLNGSSTIEQGTSKRVTTTVANNHSSLSAPLSVRRGTIAHLKPVYISDSTAPSNTTDTTVFRKRTSSNAELTSPRFEDLPKFAAFGGTTPRTPVALGSFTSPRKHSHSSASLSNAPTALLKPVGMNLFSNATNHPPHSKMAIELPIAKEFTFKEKFMDILRDEYCSNVRIALKTMNPLKFIKCLIIEDESLSRMQFYYHIHLFYALKLFLDGAKRVIHAKDKSSSETPKTPETSNLSSTTSNSSSSVSSRPNRFVQEVLRTSSATLFSIILAGLKELKDDLVSHPQYYPEFHKEVKHIQNFTSAYSSTTTLPYMNRSLVMNQVAYIAEKLTTRYFLIIFEKLNPPINFDVLKSFVTAYPSIADNKLLLIVLERAKETFYHSPMESDSLSQPFSSSPLSTLAASKQNRVEFAFLQFLVENVLPIIAREKADSRRIIDMLVDILTSRYSLNVKELCAYFRHLSGEALGTGLVSLDPYLLIITSCFRFSQPNANTLSNIDTFSSFNSNATSSSKHDDDILVNPQFFDYLIDKFEIDVNRKEILFFLLKHKQTLPYLEALKKAGKIDVRFVHRCFHSKHFAEFLTKLYYSGSVGPYQCLDLVLQQFNIDPLADFESENSFKSLEEAWKSTMNTSRSLTRSYGSTKNKDNFLKIISRIETKQNGYSATYHVNLLKIFKIILRRCKEQDKKFNLQKIDRDMKISFNFITHSFLTDLGHYHESNYRNTTLEMCELLIGSANALIDCSVLKFLLQRIEVEDANIREKNSKQIAYYYQQQQHSESNRSHTSMELQQTSSSGVESRNMENNHTPNWYNKSELALMTTVTKAMELLLHNSAMISKLTSFNTSGSKLASSMFTDIMPYSEWYSQHKLANDHSPHATQYLHLYERTRLFIARFNFNAALVEKEMRNANKSMTSCCVIL